MHTSRANRKANRERRALAAHKQRKVPLETQREIAAENKLINQKRNAALGYADPPNYERGYVKRPTRADILKGLGESLSVLDFLNFLAIINKQKRKVA